MQPHEPPGSLANIGQEFRAILADERHEWNACSCAHEEEIVFGHVRQRFGHLIGRTLAKPLFPQAFEDLKAVWPQLIRIELAEDQDFVPEAIAHGDAPCPPVLNDRGLTVWGELGPGQWRARNGVHHAFDKPRPRDLKGPESQFLFAPAL